MRACSAAGNWQLALALLNTMKKEGVPRTAFNYNVVMQVTTNGLSPTLFSPRVLLRVILQPAVQPGARTSNVI